MSLDDKLIEKRFLELQTDAFHPGKRLSQIMSTPDAHLGNLLQSLRSDQSEINQHGQSVERLIGADVGSSVSTTDVLLARLQSEREGAFACLVHSHAGQSARQLAHV